MKKETTGDGYGEDVPPSWQNTKIYFDQKGLSEKVADKFYRYYKARKWKTDKGGTIKNWKVAASNWIWMRQRSKTITT